MDNVTPTTVEINETENISTDRIKKRTMEMLHSEGQQTRPAKGFPEWVLLQQFLLQVCVFPHQLSQLFTDSTMISSYRTLVKSLKQATTHPIPQ